MTAQEALLRIDAIIGDETRRGGEFKKFTEISIVYQEEETNEDLTMEVFWLRLEQRLREVLRRYYNELDGVAEDDPTCQECGKPECPGPQGCSARAPKLPSAEELAEEQMKP
jgi:hypothetical protein